MSCKAAKRLRSTGCVAGHSFLLHQQQSIQGLSQESMHTLCADALESRSRQILEHYTSKSVDTIRGHIKQVIPYFHV
jgi:hypothetical protein